MNNDKMPNGNAEKKRFYTALYSGVGIMLVIAAFVSAANIKSANDKKNETEIKVESKADTAEMEPVNNSSDKSYKEEENPTTTAQPQAEAEEETKAENPVKTSAEKPVENKQENTSETKSAAAEQKVFSLFDESKEMSWPVNGKIVMDYSVETAIFDKTLEQYRTNDSICIAADVGTEVKAAAEGVVEDIFEDNENGKSVVINHGNGWMSTYSLLENNLMVEIGQVVGEGEVIGRVGEPTNYSVALGSHLDFKLTKDDTATDPKLVLAQYDE